MWCSAKGNRSNDLNVQSWRGCSEGVMLKDRIILMDSPIFPNCYQPCNQQINHCCPKGQRCCISKGIDLFGDCVLNKLTVFRSCLMDAKKKMLYAIIMCHSKLKLIVHT